MSRPKKTTEDKILQSIHTLTRKLKRPPSVRELSEALGYKNSHGVYKYILELRSEGKITAEIINGRMQPYSIKLTKGK